MMPRYKLCPKCDQPLLPKGRKKKAGEFDHASGCPDGADPTGAKLDRLIRQHRVRRQRYLLVDLSCGHQAREATCRERVGKATAAVLYNHLVRSGALCRTCNKMDQPTCLVAVVG